jgi:hypothetical protein
MLWIVPWLFGRLPKAGLFFTSFPNGFSLGIILTRRINVDDQNIKILDQLTAVNLSVSIWTARKKLTAEDFGGIELPPEELASLGSKKICDPESLRIFSTLKARATSHLDKIGVRFLGGWAIPDDQREFLYDRLVEVKDEFLNAKESFLNNYGMAVQNWIDKHPGWERLISGSPVSAGEVRNRLTFNWQFYKVIPPDQSAVSDSILDEAANLGQTLFGEIAKDARTIWNKVYAGKTEVSHKALSPLKVLRQKLSGLSFVEPRVAPIADLIEDTLRSMPKRGLIAGTSLLLLQGLVSVLKDPVQLIEHGQKVLSGQSTASLLNGFTGFGAGPACPDVQDDSDKLDGLEGLDGLDDLEDFDFTVDQEPLEGLDMVSECEDLSGCPDQENNVLDNSETASDKHSERAPGLDSLGLW